MILACLALSVAVALVSVADSEDPLRLEWETYKKKFGKHYSSEEDGKRLKIYTERKKAVEEHNTNYKNGKTSFTMGINHFSDMAHEERKASTRCYLPRRENYKGSYFELPNDLKNAVVPKEMDWRKKGCVTPVKEEYICNACYAFATTGAMECFHFRKTGKLVSLSEQNIVDCSEKNFKCAGGNVAYSLDYIIKHNGIDTEASYPYTSENGTCKFKRATIGATLKKYKALVPGDEIAMKKIVAKIGTVAVSANTNDTKFYEYKGGVYHVEKCPSAEEYLDHAMLVVGYGEEKGEKYWIVKNSWPTTWGEDGYIKMPRDKKNFCGIATEAYIPTE